MSAKLPPPKDETLSFSYYQDSSEKQEWRWRLFSHRSGKPEVIAASQDGHPTKVACLAEIERVKGCSDAEVIDYSRFKDLSI